MQYNSAVSTAQIKNNSGLRRFGEAGTDVIIKTPT